MRATDFTDTIGVNTHIGSDPYNNPAQIEAMLAYLGIGDIRQSSPTDASSLATMQAVGRSGIKLDLIVNGGGPVNLTGAMATIDQLAPFLNAVEGVNEAAIWPITYNGSSGVDAAVALQKDLYAAVKADPALTGAAVYMFTLGGVDPGAFPSIGDLSAYADFANIHSYPPHGLRPIFVIHAAIDGGRTDAPSKPVVLTETGYYTLPQNAAWGGVPESMQANYLLGLLLDEAAAGVARTYLYDLVDDGPDPQNANREDHFGLFHNDGSPKLAATAIHNLTVLLADAGSTSRTFQQENFSFSATGVPYNYTGNTMVFEKSDGTHIIAVWNEQQLWNPDTQTASPVQHIPVTVNLPASFSTVLVFDPMAGTSAVQTLHGVSQVNLDLTDHPLLIEVPPAQPAPHPVGQNAVVLHVSEDAWQGDAQFLVTVDGAQVGGVQTATASHSAGLSQDFSIGGLSSVPHAVQVRFINDAYGGTPATDRNLYLDGLNFGGVEQAGTAASLYSSGTSAPFTTPGASTTVTFNVSEDAYQGDAQARFTVDGQDVAGLVTITASHRLGVEQHVSFVGPLAPVMHTLAATFTNDLYGGSAATDRNLYLDSVDVGAEHINVGLALYSAGTQYLTLPAAMLPGGGAPLVIGQGAVQPLSGLIASDSA